jgi:hypothetical protein
VGGAPETVSDLTDAVAARVARDRERQLTDAWSRRALPTQVELVKWVAESSGKTTKWHLFGGVHLASPDERGQTACGLWYPWMAHTVTIEEEFGVPDEVLADLCGTCLLLAVRPGR